MRNITLVNGKNVIVNEYSFSDIVRTVKEECSYELAEMMENIVADGFYDLNYECAVLEQKMRSYESDLEDAERSLRDIWEDAEDLLNYIAESKRIDRKYLIEVLREIRLRAKENL